MHLEWQGLWVPLVTPFDKLGEVDGPALRQLVARVAHDGARGVVVCGSTGEALCLSEAEQDALLHEVLAVAQPLGLGVVMGLAACHRPPMLQRLKRWQGLGLAGVLMAAPAYVRPSQAALLAHFQAAADAAPCPLWLYDIPYRSGVALETDTLLALAEHPNIAALKDCSSQPDKLRALLAQGRLAVFAGEDAQVFGALCLGAAGAIAAASHLHTPQWVAMIQAVAHHDLPLARQKHQALSPLAAALFAEPNPAVIKALLARLGECGRSVRPPLLAASAAAEAAAWQQWQAVASQGQLSPR